MGPRLAPAQSIRPVTPVLSSWMNASGAGSVWSIDHVTDKGSVSARIASMAGGSQGWASTPGSWGESQSAWKIDVLGPMSGEPAESDAGQSGGDPALLLVGLAVQLAAGHVLEQRQAMVGQRGPSVRRGHGRAGEEPRLGQVRGDLSARNEVRDGHGRDTFRDVRRALVLDQPG